MATKNLTAESLRELLDYDPVTGVFIRRIRAGRRGLVGAVAGSLNKISGYRGIKINGTRYLEHRLAWLYVHGAWPELHIDHINGIKADNRIANLRDVSKGVNLQNLQGANSNSHTGKLGVFPVIGSNPFMARIFFNGRLLNLGRFKTVELASEAYLAAKRLLHPGCTI